MNGCHCLAQVTSYYNIFYKTTYKSSKRIFTWLVEVVEVNTLLFCVHCYKMRGKSI